MTPPVVVVGAGIAGVACARVVADTGLDVRILDRGQRIAGRMAVRTVHDRPVDVGASYLTAHDPRFRGVVDDWVDRGLAHSWTDTFHVATALDGLVGTTTGPTRFAAPEGLRSLVEDLADGLPVEHPHDVEEVVRAGDGALLVDGQPAAAVVLAMPDPQALDLLAEDLTAERELLAGRRWEPTLTLVAGWRQRCWPDLDGVFVNDSPVLTFVADDGRRRGDDAPVLVAHADAVLAAGFLDDPDAAAPIMLAELEAVLALPNEPDWWLVRRWGSSRPAQGRAATHHLSATGVGLAGDGWSLKARVEAAYLSGVALGEAVAARLAG